MTNFTVEAYDIRHYSTAWMRVTVFKSKCSQPVAFIAVCECAFYKKFFLAVMNFFVEQDNFTIIDREELFPEKLR